jgi:peptidyl-prolyl cis-trans isomerase SurA
MKNKISGTVVLLILLIAGGLACAEETNRIVAIVNNEIITYYELEKAIKNLPPSVVEKERPEEVQKQLLFQLVDQKLVELQIKRLGIQISSDEVDKTVDKIKQDQGLTGAEDFAKVLKKEGLTEKEFKNKIREQIQRFKLIGREIGSKIIIPEARVMEYYQKNKSLFQKAEGIHLALILLTTSSPEEGLEQKKKAEEIWERLKKGENFSDLARKYSQDPSAAQGGDLGVFSLNDLDPFLREVVSTLKPGEFSQVLQSPHGWQIIKLIASQDAKEVGYEEVRGQIFEHLYQEEVNLRFSQWLQQLKDRSYIQILL